MRVLSENDLYVCRKFQRSKFIIEKGAHKNNTLIFVLDGSFSLHIAGEQHVVCKNQGFVFPAGVTFERSVLKGLTILFAEFRAELPIQPQMLTFLDGNRLESTLRMLDLALQNGEEKSLLAHYLSDIFYQAYMEGLRPQKRYSSDVEAFLRYVKENLGQKLWIQPFCKTHNITHTGFILKFKKEYGKTPSAYVNELRTQLACELLLDSEWNISQIAMRCGFDNQYYFSNFFKKQTGFSPSAYRNAYLL